MSGLTGRSPEPTLEECIDWAIGQERGWRDRLDAELAELRRKAALWDQHVESEAAFDAHYDKLDEQERGQR